MTTRFDSWEFKGEFLNKYPRYAQSTIMNLFCYAVRDGFTTVPKTKAEASRLIEECLASNRRAA